MNSYGVCTVLAMLIAVLIPGRGLPAASGSQRLYSADSPWNLAIGPEPPYESMSESYARRLSESGPFGCDPTQYAIPVYIVDNSVPFRPVFIRGYYSNVTDDGSEIEHRHGEAVEVPLPDGVVPSRGTDGNVVLWNPVTGDEWGFWQFSEQEGRFSATNAYHYNTRWSGLPPRKFLSRGAGVPYLAGLIRPWEIAAGRIEHAIAVAVNLPTAEVVFPAIKSDNSSRFPDLPMGARLQLDPSLTDKDFERFGLGRAGKIIARALQEYGMIVVDGGGHPKLITEDVHTADWGTVLDARTVTPIPYTYFKVLKLYARPQPPAPEEVTALVQGHGVRVSWSPVKDATRYHILRRGPDDETFVVLDDWARGGSFEDTDVRPGLVYTYAVRGVNWNGIGLPSETARVTIPD